MHGFVRKGLLLSAATGTLVTGYAGTAAAQDDSAVTRGAAADSPGAVSGNVAQVPADVPVQVCGIAAGAVAADTTAQDNACVDDGTHAVAEGFAADSPGLVSGNVLQLAADVPVQACGDSVGVLAFGTSSEDNKCVNGGGHEMTPWPPVMSPPPMENCPPPETGTWTPQSGSDAAPQSDSPDQAGPRYGDTGTASPTLSAAPAELPAPSILAPPAA